MHVLSQRQNGEIANFLREKEGVSGDTTMNQLNESGSSFRMRGTEHRVVRVTVIQASVNSVHATVSAPSCARDCTESTAAG